MTDEPIAPGGFEPAWLDRSLTRYLVAGVVFMLALVVGFGLYRVREPSLRADASRAQEASYREVGARLYADNCASCHGVDGSGVQAPALNAREFFEETTDAQLAYLVAIGVPGTDMPAWEMDFGGALTHEQIRQIVTYLRSWERDAPSMPDWRTRSEGGRDEPAGD